MAFVPVKPGLIEIPELVVKWWNSTENRAEEARLPARTIEVLPAVAGSSASAPAAPAQPAVPLPPASPLPEAEPQIIYQPAPLASWLLWANLFWACLVLALIALLLKQRRQLTAMQQVSAADTLPARTLLPDGFPMYRRHWRGNNWRRFITLFSTGVTAVTVRVYYRPVVSPG
ncbi:hypothetical protein [Aliamphritea spongicola]|nr:hypothetical protein [Aliamphritea spongicola]